MADPKDTLLRQLALLSLIPELPRSTSTAVLREKLQERALSSIYAVCSVIWCDCQ